MKTSMQSKLDQLATRLAELNELLSREDVTSDMDQYRKLTREHAEIGPIVEQYALWRQALTDEATAQELLADPSMRDFAEDEIGEARERMAKIEGDLQTMLLPKDPNDDRNIFIEIRAGTGGDESALFAGDLLRMYLRYAERNRWHGRNDVGERVGSRRLQGSDRADRGPGRVFAAQVRIGRASRAARAGDRNAGPHPHVGVHGRGDAGSRRNQRSRDQSGRSAHRHVPRVGRGRPAHQQDRFGRARHALADGHRRRMSGRPLAAQEQGSRAEGARRAHQGQAVCTSSTRRKRRRARA